MQKVWYPGDIFPGGYEILEIIESGGMGTVYIVQNRDTEVFRAAKTYKARFFNRPSLVHSFQEEAEIWVKVGSHPHIVFADHVNNIEGIPYIFLEYVPQGSLRELLWKKIELHQALLFAIQCCEGLDFLHSKELESGQKGLIHCDLKPENILLSEGNIIKISDFGLVKTMEDSIKNFGLVVGTPSYMSPEHFRGIDQVTKLSDIYSFGVILFELLTGFLPFQAKGKTREEEIESLEYQHREVNPQAPGSLVSGITHDLNGIVLDCLKKDPDKRPSSFRKLKQDLCQIYKDITGKNYQSIANVTQDEYENIRLARSYNNLGKPLQAIEMCDEALKSDLNPEQKISAQNIKGLAFLNLEKYQEALNYFDLALKIDPQGSVAWANRGLALKGMENYTEAINSYDKAISLDPNDWGPYHNKGVTLDLMGHSQKSLEWFDRALKVNPRHVNSLASKGAVLQKLGRYEEAILWENKALSINPRDATAINNLLVIYLKLEQYDEALKWSNRLIELDLRFPLYWYNKASVLLQMGHYDLAVKTIDDGFDSTPDKIQLLELKLRILYEIAKIRGEPKYHRLIFECLMKILELNPNHQSAKQAMNEIYSIDISTIPDNAKGLDQKGELLLNIGSIDDAIPLFQKAMVLDPNYMSPYNNMGLAMEMKGNIEEAINYYSKAIDLDPSHFMPWYNKGNCLKDKGYIAEAVELYLQSSKLNPGFIGTWINMGYCYYRLGNNNKALEALERAQEIEPNNPTVLENIRMLKNTL